MDTPNIVVPPGQDPVSPDRSYSLKLRGGETGDSIMMFEETIPAGTIRISAATKGPPEQIFRPSAAAGARYPDLFSGTLGL